MRASSFLALSVALLMGLGAAAGAKYMGFFEKPANAVTVPVAAEKAPAIQVLVAGTNLFKGITLAGTEVRVRELRKDEEADYLANKKDYLPSTVNAVNMRVLADNIAADTPLKVKHFETQEIGSIGGRMDPYMRAVNVSLPKNKAVGGLLQVGERVDVLLTSKIADGSGAQPFVRTTTIARDVKIIAKRDLLAVVLQANDPEKPVSFTLQANPYRAALIDFAQNSGALTLVPRPKPKGMMMMDPNPPKDGMPNFADPDSKEYRDENDRVAQIERGEYSMGSADLVRVFNLPEIVQPMPMQTSQPPSIKVTNINGVKVKGTQVFGEVASAPKGESKAEPRRAYSFYELKAAIPKAANNGNGGAAEAECTSCGKGNKES
jgi:Flp pilus assembly protein CpaB